MPKGRNSIRGTPLQEALDKGEGIERPFRCHVHDDSSASASVNVAKGVWYCFACGSKGMTDGKGKAPSVADLAAMLEPEKTLRVYPDSWLELFDNELGNWPTRFPAWVRYAARLGCDPLTGDATFPVRTPRGQLAGAGRRKAEPGDGPRYVYPPRWSAARSVFEVGVPSEVLALVEGAGDATAVAATGCFAMGCYGSGVHFPQIELIRRRNPKLILLAFDADDAGRWGIERSAAALSEVAETMVVDWSSAGAKDPAELDPGTRKEVLTEFVGGSAYGSTHRSVAQRWTVQTVRMQAAHQAFVEEAHGNT